MEKSPQKPSTIQLFYREVTSFMSCPKYVFILFLLLSTTLLKAQGIGLYKNKYVAVTGNSIANYQAGFQSREFPLLTPTDVVFRGMDSYTCAMVLRLVIYLVPAQSNIVVLFNSTNDVANHIPVAQHMACMKQTISILLERNTQLRVIVANTPPWTHWNPCTNSYRDDSVTTDIQNYNAAYADPVTGFQALWPTRVRVADVWSPNADMQGWAIPSDMSGPCGIHPGERSVWSPSWEHFSEPYIDLTMDAVRGQW